MLCLEASTYGQWWLLQQLPLPVLVWGRLAMGRGAAITGLCHGAWPDDQRCAMPHVHLPF